MIVLASASPARAAMLTAAGVSFEAHPAHIDEAAIKSGLAGERPALVADALAELKAVKLSARFGDRLVLGCDQLLVAPGGALLDKPGDRDGAAAQLRRLMGAEHRLISAAVISLGGKAIWRAHATAKLTMRPLSEAFIADYLDREGAAIFGCVGSYRIEALGVQLFTRVEGDHFTVQGLPLLQLLDYLRIRGELAI